jgi:hypothetical protein
LARVVIVTFDGPPIKGFGVLGGYAERRIPRTAGISLGAAVRHFPAELQETCQTYESDALGLGTAAEQLLRRYGRGIVDRQADLARVADCRHRPVRRTLHALPSSESAGARPRVTTHAAAMARIFARQARRRMAASLRRLNCNEDDALAAVAAELIDKEGYRWDVM